MDWYYVEDGKRAGPVGDPEFDQLVASGRIRGETLVWREGMTNWQPCREVKPVPATVPPLMQAPQVGIPSQGTSATTLTPSGTDVVCMHCQGIFPKENTIQYGTGYVCAACKPAFVQKLKEGATPIVGMNYAGFWIRFGAKMIDVLLFTLVAAPFVIFMIIAALKRGPSAQPNFTQMGLQIVFQLGFSVLSVAYSTFFHGKYGATLGKMACGLKVVSAQGTPISYARALGRACAELLSGMICDIGYIIAAFDDQKRSLHDHIASTRVIRIR